MTFIKKTDPPFCNRCQKFVTAQHILHTQTLNGREESIGFLILLLDNLILGYSRILKQFEKYLDFISISKYQAHSEGTFLLSLLLRT